MPVEWAITQMNLATAYAERIRGDQADNIEEAIRCYEQALEVMTQEAMPVDWAKARMNLATAYKNRIRGDRADNIEEAIRGYEQVLEVMTQEAMPVDWAEARMNLATAYKNRIRGDRADNIEEAIRGYEQALEVMTRDAMPSDHQQAQYHLGILCLNERLWARSAEAFAGLLAANEILYKAAALPESRQSKLRGIRGIAARMVYSMIKSTTPADMADDMKKSVEILEQNRARWLSEALTLKSGKPEAVPDVVWNTFETCRKYYNKLMTEARLTEDTPVHRKFLELGAAMRKASEALDAALINVREHDPEFMPDTDFQQIRSAMTSARAALIYFAVTPVGSAAFIVQTGDEPVTHMLLEDLTEDKLIEQEENYLTAYEKWRVNSRSSENRTVWLNTLDKTANWLWDALMRPLMEKLIESGITRAVLIPQGLLGLLPLHAAWTEENGKRSYALDEVCYTYAPNALSLIASRNISAKTTSERLMAIDEPYAPSASPLPNSNAEVNAVCQHFSRKRILSDEMASWTAVRNSLGDFDVFHFSCHGIPDFTEPLNSGLLMANNEILTLRDFLSTELKGARLAVLSACETGIPDLKNADEVIGLPAGLIQMGVAGVAASLWSVNDLSTMILMVRFYEFWRKDNLEPPEALRQAQIWVRDTTNGKKAEYFCRFLPEFGNSENKHLPVHIADRLYKEFSLKPPDENDFEHPFYWAAFTFTGV